jgi:hypothetical protein
MVVANLRFSFSHVHFKKSLLNLMSLNVIEDVGVIEALPPLVCFAVFMLGQKLLSNYCVIIAKLAISFSSWDLTNLLLMCVQVMKQGMIEGFGKKKLSLICTLCLSF